MRPLHYFRSLGLIIILGLLPFSALLALDIQVKNASCLGEPDGEITITIQGSGPYTYAWSNGETSNHLTELEPGDYTVTITDPEGCMVMQTVTVEVEAQVAIFGGGVKSFCENDEIEVTLVPRYVNQGQCPGCTYQWNTGQTGATIQVANSGSYSVVVTAPDGCAAEGNTNVDIQLKDCEDDDPELLIPVSASFDPNDIIGPDGFGPQRWVSVWQLLPYTILFENDPKMAMAPAQDVFITLPIDSNLNPLSFRLGAFGFGSFQFQPPANSTFYSTRLDLRDSMGLFVDVIAGVDVVNREAFWILESIDPATGLTPIDASKGFLPVNDSSLGNGEGFVSFTFLPRSNAQTGDSIHAQANIVFDLNMPIQTPRIFNSIDAVAPVSHLNPIPPNLDSLILISVTATDDPGGSGVASFDLYVSENGGAFRFHTGRIPIDSAYVFRGQAGKNYCFYPIARDQVNNNEAAKLSAESCTQGADTVYLDLLSYGAGQAFCRGEEVAISWASEGIGAIEVAYSADSGLSFVPIAAQVLPLDSGYRWTLPPSFPAGDYLLRIAATNDPAVFALASTATRVSVPPVPMITALQGNVICPDDSTQLVVSPAIYTGYSWSQGDSLPFSYATQAGRYYVEVADSNGCRSNGFIDITTKPAPPQPSLTLNGSSTFCDGDSLVLLLPSGYPGYRWSSGDTTSQLIVRSSGLYGGAVIGSNGCTSPFSAELDVRVNPLPAMPAIQASALRFCAGDSVILSAPSGFATYSWSSGDTTQTLVARTPGSFAVAVTDSNGCVSPLSMPSAVQVDTLPAMPVILNTGPTRFCDGDSVVLNAPTGYAAYLWSGGDTAQTLVVRAPGSFTVSMIDNNGCMSPLSQPVGVQVDSLPAAPAVLAPNSVFCAGDSVLLSAAAAHAAYLWSTGDSSAQIWLSASQTVSLQVWDSNGCQSPSSVAVQVTELPLPAQPLITAGSALHFCAGDSVVLNAPAGYAAYSWSSGDTAQTLVARTAGSFTVSVIDNNGCLSPLSVQVGVQVDSLPAMPVILNAGPTRFCDGDSVVLNAPTGYAAYLWSGGDTAQTLVVRAPGSFTVSVTDNNGCMSPLSQPVGVQVDSLPAAPAVLASDSVFCAGDSVLLTTAAAHAAYLWSTGDSSAQIWLSASQTVSLQIRDSNGCQSPSSVAVQVTELPLPGQPLITAGSTLRFCDGDSVVLSAPSGYAAYAWSSGDTTETLVARTPGSFAVAVTDSNGCLSPLSMQVGVQVDSLPAMPVILNTGPTRFCQGDSVALTAPAGYAAYLWSNGDSTRSLLVRTPGSFSVSVTDSNGCMSPLSQSVGVQVDSLPAAPLVLASDSVFCDGDSVLLSAGAVYASYLWSTGDSSAQIWLGASQAVSLQVRDSHGCQSPSSAAVQVTELPLPGQPLITAASTLRFCDGDSVVLSAPSGYAAYAWSSGDTTETLVARTPGSFAVAVTDSNGCLSPLSVGVGVTVYALPAKPVILVTDSTVFCEGDSALLSVASGFAGYLWSSGDTTSSVVVTQSGSYTVAVTDSNGCLSPAADSVHIQQVALPASPSISQIMGTDSLVAAGNASHYAWFLDGQLLTGQTGAVLLAPSSGVYSVLAFNGLCPSDSSLPFLFIKTGIGDPLQLLVPLTIYPNPTEGFLIVDAVFSRPVAVTLTVSDALGREVLSTPYTLADGNLYENLDLGHLAAGEYFLTLEVDGKSVTRKFVRRR